LRAGRRDENSPFRKDHPALLSPKPWSQMHKGAALAATAGAAALTAAAAAMPFSLLEEEKKMKRVSKNKANRPARYIFALWWWRVRQRSHNPLSRLCCALSSTQGARGRKTTASLATGRCSWTASLIRLMPLPLLQGKSSKLEIFGVGRANLHLSCKQAARDAGLFVGDQST
jgi:hypothetical protein